MERPSQWAAGVLRDGAIIIDTETTGLDDAAQIVEVAVMDTNGNVILSTLVKPTCIIPVHVSNIHGITDHAVRFAPTIRHVIGLLREIANNRRVIIYNSPFDLRMLRQSATAIGLTTGSEILDHAECAMRKYAEHKGEWDSRNGRWKWHKLVGGDHTALGDCRATLELLKAMAEGDGDPTQMELGLPTPAHALKEQAVHEPIHKNTTEAEYHAVQDTESPKWWFAVPEYVKRVVKGAFYDANDTAVTVALYGTHWSRDEVWYDLARERAQTAPASLRSNGGSNEAAT